MSAETGGSIENIMESISTSMESLSSVIPFEKRQELSKFEMTLKEMIEEARQMAKTPGIRLYVNISVIEVKMGFDTTHLEQTSEL